MPVNKGRKSNIKNTIQTKSKKINTPWLKNAVKSIGASSLDVFKDISPNIHDIASESVSSIGQLSHSIKGAGGKNGSINIALQNNRYVKAGKDVIKNTIEDLKTGNFNNTDREMEAFAGADFSEWDMSDLESGTFFDDWDMNDESGNAVQVNNYNLSDNGGMALAIDDSFRKNTQAQLKGQKANIDVMVAVSSAHMLQQQEISNQILGHLDNISSGINSLVEFNNSTMTTFIESAVGYMEKLGTTVEDYFTGGSDKIDPSSVYRDKSGGIKMSAYKQLISQQARGAFDRTDLGFLNSMLKDNLDVLTANPLGAITKMAISSMTPKMWKNTLTQLDESIAGFMPTVLARIAEMADDKGVDKGAGLRRIIGQVFGVKNKRVNEFDMEGKITNKAVQYDQISRHALTEVIPKYLREQTSYLKAIAESIGIDTKKAVNNAEVFDYKKGKYRSLGDVRSDVYGDIRDTAISKFNMSKFGSTLRGKMVTDNEKDNESFNRMIDDFFVALERHGKYLDITNLNAGSDLDSIIKNLGYSNNMSNHLRAALKQTTNDPNVALNANTAIQQSIYARSNLIKSMQDDPTMYNLYAADLGGKIDEGINKVFKTTFGDVEKTKSGTVTELLTDVRFLLDRGINVRVTGKKAYGSALSDTRSNTKSSNKISSMVQTVKNVVTGEKPEKSVYDGKELSVEDYENMIRKQEQESFLYSIEEKNKSSIGSSASEMFKAIAFGSPSMAFSQMMDSFTNKLFDTADKLRADVVEPMKVELFGTKDKAGYSRDGLFSGMQNKFLDTYRNFMREINGKGYFDSKNQWIDSKKEGEESVVGNIKNFLSTTKESLVDYFFGEKVMTVDQKTGKEVWTGKRNSKTGNWLGKAVSTIEEGFTGWSEALFGPRDPESQKTSIQELKEKVSNVLPSTITGGIGGAAFGALSGGSVLGTLIGGPIGGAVLGAAGGILSHSDKFKNWLFGEMDESTGERVGGFISKQFQDTLKKNKTGIIGGAAVGTITGAGILGNLVGGPIGGAVLGGATSIIKNSEMMDKFLHGDADEGGWHKGIVNMFNGIFKKTDATGNESVSGKKLLGMNITGAIGGGLSAALIGKLGFLGATMTPMGPIGGAIAGLALSMKASKSTFHEWLFGKDVDINGENIHREGVLGQFKNMLDVEVFEPMKNGMLNFYDDTRNFLIDKILAPVEFAVEPLTEGFKNLVVDVKNKINGITSFIGKSLKEGFVDPIVNLTRDTIIKPMRSVFGFLFKGVTGIAKTIIGTPFEALSVMTNFADARNKRKSRKQVMRENREQYGFFGGMARNMGIRFHFGDEYANASYKYTDYAEERDERKRRYLEDRNRRREEQKANRQERADRNYNRRLIARATGNQFADDTIENRELARQMWRERKGLHLNRELKFRGEARQVSRYELTDDNIAKAAGDPTKPVENRILGQIISIKELLQGKDNNPEETKKRRQVFGTLGKKKETNTTIYDDVADVYSDENTVDLFDALVQKPLESQGFNAKDVIKESKVYQNFVNKFANLFGIEKHADGGKTKSNVVLVGEKGPELAQLPVGTEITPNNKPISAVVAAFSRQAIAQLSSKLGNLVSRDNSSLTEAQKDYEALKKEGSYEEQQREKKEAEKEAREKEMLEIAKEEKEGNKDFHYNWKSIFGKAGSITKGLLLISPLLMKLLNGGLSSILTGGLSAFANTITNNIGNVIGSFKEWGSQLLDDIGFGFNNLGGGETVGSKIDENVKETANLIVTGDVSEWVASDGNIDHMSKAKTGLLTKGINRVTSYANKGIQGLKTGVSNLVNIGKNVISDGKTAVSKAKDIGSNLFNKSKTKVISNNTKLWTTIGDDLADEAVDYMADEFMKTPTNKIVSKNTDKVTEAVAKNSDTIVKKSKGAIDNLISSLSETLTKWAGKKGGNVAKFADNILKPILDLLPKKTAWLASKLSPIIGMTGAVVSTGIGAIAFVTSDIVQIGLGALDGISGAAKLFRIDKENVDGLMKAISSVIGGFKGSTTGAILDIINELVVDCLGFDMFHEIACLAYSYIASGDKFAELNVAKEEFQNTYNSYKESEIDKEYQAYLKKYSLADTTATRQKFDGKVSSGEIKVEYMSYADFNANQNKSLGDKAIQGATKAWNTITGKNKSSNKVSVTSVSTPHIVYGGSGGRGGFGLPYFSQNDPRWKNMAYGDETMGEAGCGPNAFAMVASGLGAIKNSSVTPIEMARYAERKGFRDQTGTNWNFMDSASKDYGLNTQKQFRPTESFIDNQLSQGKPIILSGQGGQGTPYTSQGHYVVATGKDNRGNYIISDPRGRQYSGKYSSKAVANNANMAWAMSRGGRGNDPDMLNNFPFLLQGDGRWGSSLYTSKGDSSQTIESSGCGPTSMAMVLRSYGHNVSPIDTCNYSLNHGFRTSNQGTSWGFFNSIANSYGLTCIDLGKDANKVSQALDNGYPVIASMGPGAFTTGGHFIVLVGKDTNGNIVVNDPASKDRSNKSWQLSIFKREGKNFWAFNQNGRGSINSLIDAGRLTLASHGTTTTEVKTSEGAPTNIFTKIANFFTQFAEKAFTGITTGVWDTNYDLNQGIGTTFANLFGGNNTTQNGNVPAMDVEPGEVETMMYKFYRSNGFTPAATAGMMGNVYQESKFKPAMIQGNGAGPAAGLFQWENYNTKSKRWAEMNRYAQSKGKNWTDPKSQMEFALQEMRNDDWMWRTPSNSSYTHVSSFDEFKNMQDPQLAAVAFSNHFERPGKPHNETRMAAAQGYYDTYKNYNIFENDADNIYHMPTTGAFGGRGDGTGKGTIDFGSSKIIDFNNYRKTNETNNQYQKSQMVRQTDYTTGGGRGISESSFSQLLQKVDKLLSHLDTIAKNTTSSDKKLDLLGNLKNTNNVQIVNAGGKGETTSSIIIPKNSEQVVIPPRTKADNIALSIAQGF